MDQDEVKGFYELYRQCWDNGEREPQTAYALSLCSIRHDEIFGTETYDELIKDPSFIDLVMKFMERLPNTESS